MSASKNILFIMTGSVACYKACQVLSRLKQNGHRVKVVLTEGALQFIGKSTIEGLTGEAPLTDIYQDGRAMDHINLMRWADLIVVAPATANYINKIASGLGDDLASTLFLTHDFSKPFLIAPAMNTKMYLHPVTQNSIKRLRELNVEILETASGVLACGEIGSGRLLEPDLLQSEIEKRLAAAAPAEPVQKPQEFAKVPKILITAGGTSESIDDVRVITNRSTGATAARIADSLIESGMDVTFLHGKNSRLPLLDCRRHSFESSMDLQTSLFVELKMNRYDWVIQAAAVSDFIPKVIEGKISSDSQSLTLELRRNIKLIDHIKELAPGVKLVGFKLTSGADEETVIGKVTKLFDKANCDLVVHNDWQQLQNGVRKFRLFSSKNTSAQVDSIESLCFLLYQNIASGKDNL